MVAEIKRKYFCGALINAFQIDSNVSHHNKISKLTLKKILMNNDYITIFVSEILLGHTVELTQKSFNKVC